jgi:hypothetical protein
MLDAVDRLSLLLSICQQQSAAPYIREIDDAPVLIARDQRNRGQPRKQENNRQNTKYWSSIYRRL